MFGTPFNDELCSTSCSQAWANIGAAQVCAHLFVFRFCSFTKLSLWSDESARYWSVQPAACSVSSKVEWELFAWRRNTYPSRYLLLLALSADVFTTLQVTALTYLQALQQLNQIQCHVQAYQSL